MEREFRRYLECGVLAHGFARPRRGDCGHDFLIAFSCKGRGVCPSCNARRMVATAAHRTDHVLPALPVRQWVLAVPKRLRYFLERDADLQGTALHLFLRAVEQCLRAHSPDSSHAARRPPRTTPGRRVLTLAKYPPPGAPVVPRRPLTIPASRRYGQIKTCYGAPVDALQCSGRRVVAWDLLSVG
ncbi:MAG: transposase zinc-binding domain-containing protein [Burkholderiales bacterium]|nr:transposase zinc-binding domain-containing protein [Burkholderiales bacterium]